MKQLYYANSFEELAAMEDKKNDDVELGEDLNPGEADNKFVVINGKHAEMAYAEHYDGLESFVTKNKIKPKTVLRGYIDLSNKIAFLLHNELYSIPDKELVELFGTEILNYKDEEIINDYIEIADIIKPQLKVNKVYIWNIYGTTITRAAEKIN